LSAEPGPAPSRQRLHWIIWLFAIVGALGIIAFSAFVLLISTLQPHREPAEVVAEASATRFVVRDAEPIAGTNLVRITIAVGPEGSPYSSRRGDDERNILLLDRASGAVRRLLPDNSRRIARSYFLPARAEASPAPAGEVYADRDAAPGSSSPPPPPAFFALLVAQPEQDDRYDLLIGRLGDETQNFTMQGLAGVDGVWMQSPTQMALIVREGLNLFYRIVDIPSRRVVLSRRIAV
jgi:hypothetical protein